MATSGRREVAAGIFLLIVVVLANSVGVQARRSPVNDAEFAKPTRGTVKTIKSGKYGDTIDCVDIYEQPAFEHPLLKNHTIQMKPSSFLKEEDEDRRQWLQGQPRLEDWSVDCPEGTVPIIRKASRRGRDVKYSSNRFDNPVTSGRSAGHEYAQVSLVGTEGKYHGARSIHNAWTPHTEAGEISVSQVWIQAGPDETVNTVEAGWIVGVDSGPLVTRFFTYWTSDGYQSTGCYDLSCPGFVQTNNGFSPGFIVQPVSVFDGEQKEISIEIKQDSSTGHWWLRVQDTDVGYWPGPLFPNLRGGARAISWGGEIVNGESNDQHTKTQMGSGHLPSEGYFKKSAFIRQISHMQDADPMKPTPLEELVVYVSKTSCYDLAKGPSDDSTFGTHVYFGGPGLSAECPK